MKGKPIRASRKAPALTTTETSTAVETPDPSFTLALLRIAVALKTEPTTGLDELVERTARKMGLDRSAFRGFLAHHMRLLAEATRGE